MMMGLQLPTIVYLGVLVGLATGHLHTFLDECMNYDVKVKCVPACPKICMDILIIRKCEPISCTPGCACLQGWVRNRSVSGKCIRRDACVGWII